MALVLSFEGWVGVWKGRDAVSDGNSQSLKRLPVMGEAELGRASAGHHVVECGVRGQAWPEL